MRSKLNISCFSEGKTVLAEKEFSGFFAYNGEWFGFWKDCFLWNCTHIQTGASVYSGHTKPAVKAAAISAIDKDPVMFSAMVRNMLEKHGPANDMDKFLKAIGR